MEVLVPIDGSETSFRALEFALEFARRFEADVHVVHFTDAESVASEEIVDRAEGVLAEAGIEAEPEVAVDLDLDLRPGDRVGEDVVGLVEERGYDHVVMGHHGQGAVDRVILGSAAETVLRANVVPVTVVP
ncbi:MAG: universal stress protein [Halobacteriaceae archaeon]